MQILILGVTANMIALPFNLLFVYSSARLTSMLRRNERISGLMNRGLGVMFVALGLRLATEKA